MWRHVVLEGYCFGEANEGGLYPCGRLTVSSFCLCNGLCPHFAYSQVPERDVAYFVPWHLVLWDKVAQVVKDVWGELAEVVWGPLRWHLWGKQNYAKLLKWAGTLPPGEAGEEEDEEHRREVSERFRAWLGKARE